MIMTLYDLEHHQVKRMSKIKSQSRREMIITLCDLVLQRLKKKKRSLSKKEIITIHCDREPQQAKTLSKIKSQLRKEMITTRSALALHLTLKLTLQKTRNQKTSQPLMKENLKTLSHNRMFERKLLLRKNQRMKWWRTTKKRMTVRMLHSTRMYFSSKHSLIRSPSPLTLK